MSTTHPVELTIQQWHILKRHLTSKHPPSTMLIRDAMRRELGFTVREGIVSTRTSGLGNIELIGTIYLDFYDDSVQSWFMLKYSDYLRD